MHNLEINKANYIKRGLFNKSFTHGLVKEDITIKSIDNLSLFAKLIINKNKSNKFIILVHGVSIGYVGSLKYLNMFYKQGFNILIIDQRRHGKSQGKYSTYGYFERYDLNMWINYLIENFGHDIIIGLHGESMGGGTVMETIPLNNHITFIIEDCGYSNFYELMKYQIYCRYPKILYYPLCISLFIANQIIKVKASFSLKDVNPLKIISNTNIPIMFIHGKEDVFVPTYMCEKLYNAKQLGYKEILLIDKAGHAKSFEQNKNLYESRVSSFINKILANSNI